MNIINYISQKRKRSLRYKQIKHYREFLFKSLKSDNADYVERLIKEHFSLISRTLTVSESFGSCNAHLYTEFGTEYWGAGDTKLKALQSLCHHVYIRGISCT